MRLSGRELLRTLNEYFNQTSLEAELFFLLLIPFFLTGLIYFLFRKESAAEKDPFAVISRKDMDFIESVRLEKKLESFDRDFLLNMALNFKIKPAYQVFIDKSIFESMENFLREELEESGKNIDNNKRMQNLRHLKKKLFI